MIPIPRTRFFIRTHQLVTHYLSLLRPTSPEYEELFGTALLSLFERKHYHSFSSCRMAVYFGLKALALKPGDEILITPITIPDIINAILANGLKPVFVDMDKNTHCISLSDLQSKLTSKSRVLFLTYLSGLVPEMSPLTEFCTRNNLFLIDDISQAYTATSNGHPAGFHSHFSVGSLTSGKIISSLVGGFLLTNSQKLSDDIFKLLATHKPMPPTPKGLLRHYLLGHLFINLLTSTPIFTFLIFPILYFRGVFLGQDLRYIQLARAIKKAKRGTRDIFFDIIPVKRQFMPESFFCSFTPWQAHLALKTLGSALEATRRRRELVDLFLRELSPSFPRGQFPALSLSSQGCTHYHLPFDAGHQVRNLLTHLLRHGIDATGYGLNLCSEERVFSEYSAPCPVATSIKTQTIFLPIHETFTETQIKWLARVMNKFFQAPVVTADRGEICN